MAGDLYNKTLVDALKKERSGSPASLKPRPSKSRERGFFSAKPIVVKQAIEPQFESEATQRKISASISPVVGLLAEHRLSRGVVTHKVGSASASAMAPAEFIDATCVLTTFNASSHIEDVAPDSMQSHPPVVGFDAEEVRSVAVETSVDIAPPPRRGAISGAWLFTASMFYGIFLSLNLVTVALLTVHYFGVYRGLSAW